MGMNGEVMAIMKHCRFKFKFGSISLFFDAGAQRRILGMLSVLGVYFWIKRESTTLEFR